VWTANGDVGSISYIDIDARVPLYEHRFGADVTSVALSPDAAWIAAVDRSGGTVSLFDAETREARATIPVGGHPRACVWDAANPRWVYVAVEDDGIVAVVDRVLAQVSDRIPVWRLPSGLAVSSARRELYVAHRIDPQLTIVDLHDRSVALDIVLADEPYSAVNTPNGKPFAFEAPALTAEDRYAWLPHELLAPTHPFVFNETLFPAISVVDLINRVEAQTDPNNPPTILGRKNLFDAINLIGPDGQPEVFSQLCAVTVHPNGFVGWALACASEDVLSFDVSVGIATDAIRNLPLDHPVGMSLDDTGQRLFVLGDQSHTLITLDTANGSLVQHTRVYGDPIPTIRNDDQVCPGAKNDPCDPVAHASPALRAGLTLFDRANSSKGPLATAGNDWMSCGGCHLDGFTSTNARFFEALSPADPAKDALIGHVGLVDHFSTVLEPASFNPHDLLVALLDQGGLAPDRTGRDRSGAIDPNHPTPDAVTMAQELGQVVARDLPDQPSWEHPEGAPNGDWDVEYCGGCHQPEFQAWSASVHSRAISDRMVTFCLDREPQFERQCSGCHNPIVARLDRSAGADAAPPQAKHHGVTCLGCHDVEREMRAGGNGDLVTVAHADWGGDHKARALASLDTLRQPEFCGGCHQQFVPGNGFAAISTYGEYHASAYPASGTRCIDCHMQKGPDGIANHRFPGGNVFLGQIIGDATLLQQQRRNLSTAVQLAATRIAGGVQIVVSNRGAGHSFPTGVTDLREPWVEVQQVDAAGNVVQRWGGPGADGLLPADAARLGSDIADVDGGVLLHHDLSLAARVPFDLLVPPNAAQSLFVSVPSTVPTSSLQAVLYYRNVRTTYYRDATGDSAGHAPDVELTKTAVLSP
jgi:DNA-binding beta-propeller fold protein YncE